MASVGDAPSVGPQLTLPDVRQLVEAISPAIRLEYEEEALSGCPRGRFLVARHEIKAGEAFLSECPLFCGGTDGERSRKAYLETFVSLLDAHGEDEDQEDFDEDCFHPRSPLTDCLAGVVRTKWQALHAADEQERAEASLRIRKLGSLCRASAEELVQEECARDLFAVLRPELQEVTSEEELRGFVLALVGNRFGGAESKLDLMFAGSMFEHSCAPNCFVGTWRGTPAHKPRRYRALRDIAPGEALSIDYLHMPDAYLPAPARAELLARWGFTCNCPRCTAQPELTRCFICQACGAAELCPARPDSDAGLECRACGAKAEPAHAERCREREEEALQAGLGGPASELLGPLHCTSFVSAWARVADGPAGAESLSALQGDARLLVDAISRLYGDPRHPHLLDFYHLLAQLALDDLGEQLRYLELERSVLRRYYAEEATRLDEEIMHLIQGRGPFQEAPAEPAEDLSNVDFGTWVPTGLDGMD